MCTFGLVLFYLTLSLFTQPQLPISTQQTFSDSTKVVAMVDLSGKLLDAGSMRKSTNLLIKARKKADSLNSAYLVQLVNASLAEAYLTADKADSAVMLMEHTLKRFPNSSRKADILNMLATAYRFQAKYPQSLKAYRKAKAASDSVESPSTFAAINQNMAVVYANMGNRARALEYYLQGVKYAEAAKDSIFLANVLNNVGETYNRFSQPEKAGYYLERSIKISKNIGFKIGTFRSVVNLANTKKDLGRYKAALSLYERALALQQQVRPDTPPLRIIYNLGDMHLRMGNINQAEKNFKQSLEYSREAGIPQGLYYNYSGLAKVAYQRGELNRAIDYYQKSLAVAEKIGAALFQKSAAEEIYRLHKELGNFKKALSYHEKFKVIADSLREVEIEQELAKTEALLSLRKQEQINSLLQQKQQEQQARIRTQNWLIAAGVFIILVTLFSLILIYRTKVEKQQINRELESQRNQLQQLNKVKDKMLAIIAHDLRSPMSSMQSMLYLLREDDLSREDVEAMWAQLELSVSQNINMMDNLLAWAQEQMSGMVLNVQTVSAREVVEEVFGGYEFKADQKGVSLINDVAEGLKVQADLNLLKLILRNLVANSIKFTRQGDSISVNTREESGKIVFEVSDTGIGIPENEQRDLFSMAGNSREGTANEKGSGLGLQLCKEFVEKQDGEIAVKSIEGEGTTFSFSLPRAS